MSGTYDSDLLTATHQFSIAHGWSHRRRFVGAGWRSPLGSNTEGGDKRLAPAVF